MKRLVVLVPLLLGVGCTKSVLMGASVGRGADFPPRVAGASYPNWEYICASVGSRDGVTQLLNRAGSEGWELVSFDGSGITCFKRPVVAEAATVTTSETTGDTMNASPASTRVTLP